MGFVTLLISFLSFSFMFALFYNYLKTKNSSKLLMFFSFMSYGIGWFLILMSSYSFESGNTNIGTMLIKSSVIIMSSMALFYSLMLAFLVYPKRVKEASIIGSLLALLIIICVLIYPITFNDGDFIYSIEQKLSMLPSVLLFFIISYLFISFFFKYSKENNVWKSLFFGLGILVMTAGTLLTVIISADFYNMIFRIVIIAGIILTFIGSIVK